MDGRNEILVIKCVGNGFDDYYNHQIQQKGIHVWNENITDREYSKNLLVRHFQLCFRMAKHGWISDSRKYKIIIVFDIYNLIPWIFLFKRCETRLILWKWNTVTPKNAKRIKIIERLCEVWTFDTKDAEQYNWHLNSQFCFCTAIESQTSVGNGEKRSAFFVGFDKGRYRILHEIYNILKQFGFYCDFWLIKDENRQYDTETAEWVKKEMLPYEQVLEHISACNVILDIVKEGQRGFTLRVLESIFYQKKLITNNKAVLNTDVYSANNIFIIDYDKWDDLEIFMEKPYQALPKEILDQYTFDSWLNNFG